MRNASHVFPVNRLRLPILSAAFVALAAPQLAAAQAPPAAAQVYRVPATPAATATKWPSPTIPSLEAVTATLRNSEDGGAASAVDVRAGRRPDGALRALLAPPGHHFSARGPVEPAGLARAFLRSNAGVFRVNGHDFAPVRVAERRGRFFVRLQQTIGDVPVFGAQAIVQIDARGGIEAVLADLASEDGVALTASPVVSAGDAAGLALAAIEGATATPGLEAGIPELVVYDPPVIGNAGPRRLSWKVTVRHPFEPIDELVFVDAATGAIAFHFSQIKHARNRVIRDCNGTATCAVARVEGGPATGIADVDLAYAHFGDTYDYYSLVLGRDSIDAAGMMMSGYVRACPRYPLNCPYANAYWDSSANRMVFGTGYANADDVVAHELTHGVTDYESALIYWAESGAINEALSDIFGELLDLTNGRGQDTAGVRWLMGEDLPIGAIRDMRNPTAFGDPDRRYSPDWFSGEGDNRGVHINSGVGNKLAFLLTDGQSFNGLVVTGLGTTRVAQLFYEVQTTLLLQSADYADLYWALFQAAVNLGWTASERGNLERACRAVEIAVAEDVQTLIFDGFEGAFPGAWGLYGATTYWNRSTARAAGGVASAWCAGGGAVSPGYYRANMDTWIVRGPFSLAEAAQAWMEYDLWFDVEPQYDFFWVGYSTDGEWFTLSSFSYPENQGYSPGWVHETLDLAPARGEGQVWVAFRFTSDEYQQYEGVYVDNVHVVKALCGAPEAPSATAPAAAASGASYDVTWTETTPLVWFEIQESTDPGFAAETTTYQVYATSRVFSHTAAVPTTYYYRSRAIDVCNAAAVASPWSATVSTVVGTCPARSLSINDVSVSEGDSGTVNAVFTVLLSASSGCSISVDWATADGSAIAPGDYTAAAGTVTVEAGQTSGTITVAVKGDTLAEANETFLVNLSNAANASIADGQGVGTILDDDAACTSLTLTGQTLSGTATHSACDTLILGPALSIAASSDIILSAGRAIVMRSGVSIAAGAQVRAVLAAP